MYLAMKLKWLEILKKQTNFHPSIFDLLSVVGPQGNISTREDYPLHVSDSILGGPEAFLSYFWIYKASNSS